MAANHATRALRDAAPIFAALGDPTRLGVVARLCDEGPLSITELTLGAHVTRQAVTKHLAVLSEAGLVACARDGRETVFQLKPERITQARHLLDRIAQDWDQKLDRLKHLLEG